MMVARASIRPPLVGPRERNLCVQQSMIANFADISRVGTDERKGSQHAIGPKSSQLPVGRPLGILPALILV